MGELYRQFIERNDLDIHKWHDYFPIYERHFATFRGTAPKMLEIGVQRGGSARLFADWLGAGTRITGVDIDERCRAHAVPGLIDIEIGDQTNTAFLGDLARKHGPWNIILDDGGHTDNQILTSFDVLFPHLAEGGIYLIEDTHAHFFDASFRDHPEGKSVVTFVADLFSGMHRWTGEMSRFAHWHVPPPERREPVDAPATTRYIQSVHLYDSVIVIQKKTRHEPFCEVRTRGVARATPFRVADADAPSESERLMNELQAMRQSTSWRLTAPLRRLANLLKGR
ncbi:MAG: class I SAM-dependent methyltransferase [Hyphomicrobium sp.]